LYSITGTRNFLFFYFPHVQLSTIDPGVFFEQSKSICHNDALQQILHFVNYCLFLETNLKKTSNLIFQIDACTQFYSLELILKFQANPITTT
jgi:hypothetical protein